MSPSSPSTSGPEGALVARIERLLTDVGRLVQDEAADITLSEWRRSLHEPLRIAVVGRVSTGKSTLVNALIGRRVAPTRAGECTRVVTWYRAGSPEGADLQFRDGTSRPLPFVDDRLPVDLGVPVEAVDRVDVRLQSRALADYTLVDTPGLATLTVEQAEATRRALLGEEAASQRAATHADAILFLFGDADRRDDVDFLRDYRAASGELGASALNAIGILSRADLFGGGPSGDQDSFDAAERVARSLTETHAGAVSTVLPVAGLLGEAANTGRIGEEHARVLARLAPVDRAWLPMYEDMPLPDGVDRAAIPHLMEAIGPYAVDRGRGPAVDGAEQLVTWLRARSGVEEIRRLVHERFTRRAVALKADHILGQVARLDVRDPVTAAPGSVGDVVERARLDPALHRVRELRALHRVLQARIRDAALLEELQTVVDGTTPADRLGLRPGVGAGDVRRAALERAADAQRRLVLALAPEEMDALRVLNRSYALLADRAAAAEAST